MRPFAAVSEYPHTDMLCRECRDSFPSNTPMFRVPGSEDGHYNGHGDYICEACYADMDADPGSLDWDEEGNGR